MSETMDSLDPRTEAANTLATDWAGLRLSFQRFGERKTLDKGQKQTAADNFDAQGDFLSAS